MQYYATGRRYRPVELPLTPANCLRSGLISAWSRRESDFYNSNPSGLYRTSSSDCWDETLLKTPCTPVGAISPVDPCVVQTMSMSMISIYHQDGSTRLGGTMKENAVPPGYDVFRLKKSLNPNANMDPAGGAAYVAASQQRAALQSVRTQGLQMPRHDD
jgi:hypothetical protein